MGEFLKFLGFKTQSDTAKRTRDLSSGQIADLFYQGTLDLFAPWMEKKVAREKYCLLFERITRSETKPHFFKSQNAYFSILSLLYDIINDPLLRKFKDIKNTQINEPSNPLEKAFRKALGMDRVGFKKALDEYCKAKKSPKRRLQPEIVGLFDDFKDYYCKQCYLSSPPGGKSNKRISTPPKIQALSEGVSSYIASKLRKKFSAFLTENLGFKIPQKRKGSMPNIEGGNVAHILLNSLSKLLKLPKDSPPNLKILSLENI